MCWNIFAGSGSGYSSSLNQVQGTATGQAAGLLNLLYPGAQAATSNALAQQAPYEQDIQNTLQYMSPGNVKAQQNAYANQAFGNAARAAGQDTAQEQGGGLSSAYSAGNTTAANQAAATASNQYNAQTESPEYLASQAAGRLQLYNAAMNSPILSQFQTQYGNVEGAAKPTVQQNGLGQFLGNVAGTALTGGFGNLGSMFGGGSGGSDGGGDTSGNYNNQGGVLGNSMNNYVSDYGDSYPSVGFG